MPRKPLSPAEKARRRYQAQLRLMELPDCDCERERPPCGCREYCQPGTAKHGPVADCDCPIGFSEPCRHIRNAKPHALTFAEWTEMLWLVYPDRYFEPPAPPEPTLVLSRPARSEVMARRRAAGHGLWNYRDATTEQFAKLGWRVGSTGNNKPYQEIIVIEGREDTPAETDRPGWDAEMLMVLERRRSQRAGKA